jgi:predicted TIM-barrel fold metal-dependent hydrolase
MELKYGLISADDHVQEHPEVWTSRMSKQKWGDRIPHLERQAEGNDCWLIAGKPIAFAGIVGAASGDRAKEPKQWKDVPASAYRPHERLKALDLERVDYSVLYPTVAGLAAEAFGRIDDLDLELACVQAYNDWLIEEWAQASPRFVPQCIVPVGPMERTTAEIKRAVARGHKGVIFPASPTELREVPHINEPAYDPLWQTCENLNVPICFHSGASPKIQMQPSAAFAPAGAAAFRSIVRSVSSIAVLANFLFSRVLYRFPELKVVFADASLGWGAYEIEYADYQSEADGLQAEGYPLKPSELFQRQCYLTCSYDRVSLRLRRYVGSANILWSTHFPLATSSWPNTEQHIESGFGAIGDDEKAQILWRNAARLYALS